jgi:hypothetical protein
LAVKILSIEATAYELKFKKKIVFNKSRKLITAIKSLLIEAPGANVTKIPWYITAVILTLLFLGLI